MLFDVGLDAATINEHVYKYLSVCLIKTLFGYENFHKPRKMNT